MTAPRSIDNRISPAEARSGLLATNADIARAQRRQLAWILECERAFSETAHRSFTEWLGAQLSISQWDARRRLQAAHALRALPHTDAAFERGDLLLDKIVELCRFASPDNERDLVAWAIRVKPRTIKQRADVEAARSIDEARDIDRSRFLRCWWMDDGRLGLEGAFPPDQGAVIARSLDRAAGRVPDLLAEDDGAATPDDVALDVRRADALYALASTQIANDQDADRATVVVHAELQTLASGGRGCEIEHGPALHVETARRLSCDGRTEIVLHNALGEVVGVGRRHREPPPWMVRQLRHRDRGCTFPGCELKRFVHAHHIKHWSRGGSTDLDNLVLVCTFHHKLLHEYGWNVELIPDGTRWRRPGGTIYEPGRATREREFVVA